LSPRGRGLLRVAAAYAAGAGAAFAAACLLRQNPSPVWIAAAADAAATLAVFAFSVLSDNSSLYDPYWSVAPPAIAAFWLLHARPGVPRARQALTVGLLAIWAARLTWNWARRWRGIDHEDWRYVDLRRQTGRAYWPVSLAGLHLVPTALVFAGCLPLWWIFAVGKQPIGPLDALFALVTAAAIVLEAAADQQLHRFAASRPAEGALLESGLWAWSRHPNYSGEVLLWWGLYGLGVAAGAPAWTGAGALAITLLFLFVSIPLVERRMEARRPGYRERRRGVPQLLLWPPRRR
jgi:steroid 5-alpha reductase family enzyme